MLNPLKIPNLSTLCLLFLLIPSFVYAEYELTYKHSRQSDFFFAVRNEPNEYKQSDGSDSSVLKGERQSIAYVNYGWSKYVGLGIEIGRLSTNDRTRTLYSGNYYALDLDATVIDLTFNLHIPITDFFSFNSGLGYGSHHTQASMKIHIPQSSYFSGSISEHKLNEDAEHITLFYSFHINPFQGWFLGFGQHTQFGLLDIMEPYTTGLTPLIWKVHTYYITLGYRFGALKELPRYSPPSGKRNTNDACLLFKAC